MKIKESKLKEILAEVEADLAEAFDEGKRILAKSSNEESLVKDESKEEPSKEPLPEESSPAPESSGAEGSPESSSFPEASSSSADESSSPEGSEPAAQPEENPAEEAELTPEALQAEYAKLPPEELEMHLQAALAAKAALAGPAPESAPEAPPAAPPPEVAAPPAAPPLALKNEETTVGVELAKSEELQSLREDVENLTKALKMVISQPVRKAITSVAYLAKSESEPVTVSPATAKAKLVELSARNDLKKSERQLILDYYDGRVSADKLAPLFEAYK